MATRKIIDIEQSGEKVWPKGHAKAIYMSDGSTIEDSIKYKVSKVKVNGVEKSPSSGVVDVGSVVTSVKVNGASKTPTNGEVDLGKAVSSVKINGFTYTPTNGLVDLGLIANENNGYPIEIFTQVPDSLVVELNPNRYYIFDNSGRNIGDLTLSFSTSNDVFTEEYVIECRYIDSILLPAEVIWVNNTPPDFSIAPYVIISICRGIGIWCYATPVNS